MDNNIKLKILEKLIELENNINLLIKLLGYEQKSISDFPQS